MDIRITFPSVNICDGHTTSDAIALVVGTSIHLHGLSNARSPRSFYAERQDLTSLDAAPSASESIESGIENSAKAAQKDGCKDIALPASLSGYRSPVQPTSE